MASEFSITFVGAGGHNHNGAAGSGSLISTSSYSIFDWNTSTIGDQTRVLRQVQNKINLENWILELINSREISPRVLRLKPASLDGKIIVDGTLDAQKIITGSITGPLLANGTISGVNIVAGTINGPLLANGAVTGVKIAANTITADNITAKTITGAVIADDAVGSDQVDDVMSIINLQSDFIATNASIYSTDYNGTTPGTGSAGWRLWANGDAEFNDVYVRGTVIATNGAIGAYAISSDIEADSTRLEGLNTNNYRLTLTSNATIDARLIYIYDSVNDTHDIGGFTSRVLINQGTPGSGASIIVNSTNGGNSVITPGIVDVNNSVTAPSIYGTIYATTSGPSATSSPIHQNGSGNALYRASSKREYKYDIKDFTEIGLIDKLQPRIFKWKTPVDREETEIQKTFRENSYDIGFIAEEVAEIENGRLANFEDDDKQIPSFWKYLDIIALLVAEVKDLRKRVKTLENGV